MIKYIAKYLLSFFLPNFKETNKELYKKIKYRTPYFFITLLIPPLRRKAVLFGYKQLIKKTKWN